MTSTAKESVEEFDSSDEDLTPNSDKEKTEATAHKGKTETVRVLNEDKERDMSDSKSSLKRHVSESESNPEDMAFKKFKTAGAEKDLGVELGYNPEKVSKLTIQDKHEHDESNIDSIDEKEREDREDNEAAEESDDIDETSKARLNREDEFGLDRESVTHQQLMDLTSSSIASLIESDPLLSDLPRDVTLEEITSQIALVQGQSISVMLAASQPAKLVVAQEGCVLDLKRSLQRHTALRLARQGRSKVKVNWRYFWRTHWLVHADGTRLNRDSDKLQDVGVVNKSVLTFCKRLNERQRTRM